MGSGSWNRTPISVLEQEIKLSDTTSQSEAGWTDDVILSQGLQKEMRDTRARNWTHVPTMKTHEGLITRRENQQTGPYWSKYRKGVTQARGPRDRNDQNTWPSYASAHLYCLGKCGRGWTDLKMGLRTKILLLSEQDLFFFFLTYPMAFTKSAITSVWWILNLL